MCFNLPSLFLTQKICEAITWLLMLWLLVDRSSEVITWTVCNERVFIFHDEWFQPPASCQCRKMIEIASICSQIATFMGPNIGPTWVLSAPGRPHVGRINLVIRVVFECSTSESNQNNGPEQGFLQSLYSIQKMSDKKALFSWINSLRPSDAYMRQLTRPSLVQIMACRLDGAKQLSEPLLEYC